MITTLHTKMSFDLKRKIIITKEKKKKCNMITTLHTKMSFDAAKKKKKKKNQPRKYSQLSCCHRHIHPQFKLKLVPQFYAHHE
jgi:hypothetical protein